MSRETAEARSIAHYANAGWREHIRACPACAIAARRRRWAELCPDGRQLRADSVAADRSLAENRALDKLPSPDQEALFRCPD